MRKWLSGTFQKFWTDLAVKLAQGFAFSLGGTAGVVGAANVVTTDLVSGWVVPPEVSGWMAVVQTAAEKYIAQ